MTIPPTEQRKRVLDALALCPPATFDRLYAELAPDVPAAARLRGPETGSVMLRGRIGGGGAAFNLGEASVTRASVRLPEGPVGHAMLLGRHAERTVHAAHLDALWQTDSWRALVEKRVVAPAIAARAAQIRNEREEAEATRVDFFTLVRGEDE